MGKPVERTEWEWQQNQAIADWNTRENTKFCPRIIAPDNRFAGQAVAIVGGGPSLAEYLQYLADFDWIVACNGAHDWLISRGIKPTHWLSFDHQPVVAGFVRHPIPECTYMPAMCCDPLVFQALQGQTVHAWLASQGDDHVQPMAGHWVGGGPTSPLRAIALAYGLGAREMGLFGLDSSFSDTSHAYGGSIGQHDNVFRAGKFWKTNRNMLEQAEYLRRLVIQRPADLFLSWYCDGLGPALARS